MIFDMRGAVSWRQKNTFHLLCLLEDGSQIPIATVEDVPDECRQYVVGDGEWYIFNHPLLGEFLVHIKKAVKIYMSLN